MGGPNRHGVNIAVAPHPAIQALLDASSAANLPAVEDQPLETVRASAIELGKIGSKEPRAVARVFDAAVAGPAGAVPVRVYHPEPNTKLPVVIYLHGGGWVFMGIETHDSICRRVALETGAVVINVEYRLAPENKFPAPLDDCLAVVRAALDPNSVVSAKWGGDSGRVAIAGDSAGGNLAAAAALVLRQESADLAAQVLIYPVCDAQCATPSFDENGNGYFLTAKTMRWFWEQYLGLELGTNPDRQFDERASVAHARDLSGLPPALVITAEFDPLRDEGEAYADQLRNSGNRVTTIRYDGMIHGFIGMDALVPEAETAVKEIGNFLRTEFTARA